MSAETDEAARAEDNRQRRWVESIRGKSVAQVASDVGALGNALLVWVDANGELRAQRIAREASTIREYVPAYLSRGGPV